MSAPAAPVRRGRPADDWWWDVGPAAVLLLLCWVGTGAAARNQGLPHPGAAAYALASVAALALLVRRRWPLVTLAVCGVAISVYLLLGYPFGPVLLTGPVAAYAVATRVPWRTAAVAGAAFALVTALPHALDSAAGGWVPRLAWAVGWTAVVAAPGAVGAALRVRRRADAGVRAEQARRAVSEERLAIAREVHDGVGHGLAVIALQSGVALHVLDKDPARARELLAAIQATSRESLDGLRAELLRFRDPTAPTGTAALRPAPGLADLPALLGRMREGGLVLHATLDDCPGVPAEVGVAAHRIVQEALTNVLRHAGDTPVWVTLRCTAGTLLLEVRDHGRGPVDGAPAGLGIPGMRARAAAVGGRLQTSAEDGFVVRAELPLPAGGADAVIRVAVVDDQALVRMGLRALLETEEDTELVGEAADGLAGLALVRAERPDVVLMDVRMPELDGLEALRRIAADPELSAVRVIVLTTFELDEYVFAALAAGASGFVLKDGEPAELLRAVRVVADGGSLLSPTVTRRVIEHFAAGPAPRTGPRPGVAELTEREREIVAWVATGRSNDEIAAALVVSPATVRTHVSRAMLKLRARDRAQLVVFAIESGLRVEQ